MIIKRKPNVILDESAPVIRRILGVLEMHDWSKYTNELVITSGNDSVHSKFSKHYSDQAMDVRSKACHCDADKTKMQGELQSILGPQFTVLLENFNGMNEHFHIQLKKGLNEYKPGQDDIKLPKNIKA